MVVSINEDSEVVVIGVLLTNSLNNKTSAFWATLGPLQAFTHVSVHFCIMFGMSATGQKA